MKISLEGNVAVGKSTVLEHLRYKGVNVYPEPVHEWTEILPLFYHDQKRWSFAFQMQVLLSFLTPRYENNTVVERSPLSCRYVFGQTLHAEGSLSDKEMELFKTYYTRYGWEPDVIIYIKTSPKVCMQRINSRSRNGEDKISLEYIKKLDFHYENMIKYFQQDSSKRVFVIDGNQSADVVAVEVENIVKSL